MLDNCLSSFPESPPKANLTYVCVGSYSVLIVLV
jgi:hypothetical protein